MSRAKPISVVQGRKTKGQGDAHGSEPQEPPSLEGAEENDLPQDWAMARLRDTADGEKETLNPQDAPAEEFDYYSIPAYQEGDRPAVAKGREILSLKILVEDGTVLFGKLNPRVPKVWLVNHPSQRRKLASTEFIPLIPQPIKATADFLFYLCWSDTVMPKAQELVSGSTPSRQRVDAQSFLDIPIPLPPLPEQRAITGVLRTVQAAKQACEQVLAATRQLKQSLLHHLFTYGPVPLADAAHVPLKETEIGAMPDHWEVERLDAVMESMLGKMLSPKAKTGKSPKPYLRNANVQWGRFDLAELYEMDFADHDYTRYGLLPGDILVCEGGEVGRTAIWRGAISGCHYQKALHRLRPRGKRMGVEFFAYHMFHAFQIRKSYGEVGTVTTIAHLPGVKLKTLPVPVPPLPEQREIAAQLAAVDAKLAAEESRHSALAALFQSLLHHLMTGKVRLPEFRVKES